MMCAIEFVGLFDTVVSSYLWGKRSVVLDPDCAERVVHIVAADEWRFHFDLTRITDDAAGTDITETTLPKSSFPVLTLMSEVA